MRYMVIRTTYIDADSPAEAISATAGRHHDEVHAQLAPRLTAGERIMPSPLKDWWTTKDVAGYLHVKGATISNYRRRQQMPPSELIVGRTHAWRPKTIIDWERSRPRIRREAS